MRPQTELLRVGIVVAEEPAGPGEGVSIQFPGPLILTEVLQVDGEVVGRAQGKSTCRSGWGFDGLRRASLGVEESSAIPRLMLMRQEVTTSIVERLIR